MSTNPNSPKEIILIAAAAENNALGLKGNLLWHLPDDFKHFKAKTSGHYIIMGRKTFETFPKPLPNRTHVIITRQKNYSVPESCLVVSDLNQALEICPEDEPCFVIGGGEIYTLALSVATKIELTRVHESFEADTFFPEFSTSDWEKTFEKYHAKDEKHDFDFTFETWVKKA